ncbi:MAG: hypothetical protein ACD_50C00231G0012 [uncultured bacterium]|nr:MAG: hypothetical protein ACD_50C00231G0012 [uncultured bacterium]OGH14659.1 MAG: hypothetical protein A2687_00580 [Candidatus Levybacteria bacterium RIFCSPHIGHO2_01_FULL_38_26]
MGNKEVVPNGDYLQIEQENGKGVIFVANVTQSKDSKILSCDWPANSNLGLVSAVVRDVYPAYSNEKSTEGSDGESVREIEGGQFWFDPTWRSLASRAGVKIRMEGMKDEAFSSLDKIANVASRTVREGLNMPEDLNDRLKKFAASAMS